MRLRCRFKLKENYLPADYRRLFISFIKKSFSNYNEDLYNTWYSGSSIPKPFAFSVRLANPKFKDDMMFLGSNDVDFYFTTENMEIGLQAYNAFLKQKGKDIHISSIDNSMMLTGVFLVKEKSIYSNKITIRFNSPLVVRDHNSNTEEDYYYSYGTEGFDETLKRTLKEQIKFNVEITDSMLDEFTLTGISPKKTVVKFYEQQIECSIGIYEMQGHPALLEYLYKNGMGSRRSSGFGVFEII